MHDRQHGDPEHEPVERQEVLWWSLDRQGHPIDSNDQAKQLPRHAGSPPLKNGSPFTPSEYDEFGQMPPDHLHVENGQITGIHGEGQLDTLRLMLLLCLEHEAVICTLVGCRRTAKQVPLSEVLKAIKTSR